MRLDVGGGGPGAGPGFRLEGMLGGYAFRSPGDVAVIAVDGAETRVASLGDELIAWDAATGELLATHPFAGKALALSADGAVAFVGLRTGALAAVDLASGTLRWKIGLVQGDEGSLARRIVPPVQHVAWAGGLVAASLETGSHVHLVRDGRLDRSLPGSGPLALAPDGGLLVAGASVHDVASGAVLHTFEASRGPALGHAHRAAFTPDGARLAVARADGTVELWDVAALRAGQGAAARVASGTMPVARWDRQGRPEAASAMFALADGAILTSTGTELHRWLNGSIVATHAFHADTVALGRRWVWGVRRKRALVALDPATGESAGQPGHLAAVKAVAHSPRAPLALTGGADARVLLWHLPTGTVLRELPDAWGSIEGAIFFPDGRRVAAIDADRLFVWDAATRELTAKLERVSPRESGLRENLDLDASPDGRHALVCTHSDHVLLWDAEASRTVSCREVEGVRSASFGTSSSNAVLGAWKQLLVFDLESGAIVRHIDVEPDPVAHRAHLVFAEGRRAVRPCTGRGLFVYDLQTSARSLVPVTDDVLHLLALSPDGALAVVATSDDPTAVRPVVRSSIGLVKLDGGARTTIPLEATGDRPTCASFSGDGATLLVGTERGVVLRYALGAAPAEEAATRVMAAFPDLRPGADGASAPSAAAHVVIAPPRVEVGDDGPASALSPLATTSPRGGTPSSLPPGSLEARREEAIGILRRVGALHARGAHHEALAFAAPLRKHLFESFPPGDPVLVASIANIAELHVRVGEVAQAQALHEEALDRVARTAGEGSDAFATALSNAGSFFLEVRDLPRAEALHRRALDLRRALFGDRHPLTAQSTGSLGFVLARVGRPDLAEPLYRAALDALRATVGPSHPEHAKVLHHLGVLVGQGGRFEESEALLRESLAARRATLPPGHADVAQGLASLGTLYLVSRRPALAEPLYREALELARRASGDAAIETSTRAVDLAVALRALLRVQEAIPLLQRALEARLAKLPADDVRIANVRKMLADLGAG